MYFTRKLRTIMFPTATETRSCRKRGYEEIEVVEARIVKEAVTAELAKHLKNDDLEKRKANSAVSTLTANTPANSPKSTNLKNIVISTNEDEEEAEYTDDEVTGVPEGIAGVGRGMNRHSNYPREEHNLKPPKHVAHILTDYMAEMGYITIDSVINAVGHLDEEYTSLGYNVVGLSDENFDIQKHYLEEDLGEHDVSIITSAWSNYEKYIDRANIIGKPFVFLMPLEKLGTDRLSRALSGTRHSIGIMTPTVKYTYIDNEEVLCEMNAGRIMALFCNFNGLLDDDERTATGSCFVTNNIVYLSKAPVEEEQIKPVKLSGGTNRRVTIMDSDSD